MATLKIPYDDHSLDLHINEQNLRATIQLPVEQKPEKSARELVLAALQNPVGTPSLRNLAVGKQKVVIITSDHTRAVPSKITLPILLSEIRAGNPQADITILIATGAHRATTEAEQRAMFGDEIVDHEKIVVNDAFRSEDFEYICDLPSGAHFSVNKLATECDLLIAEGFVEPHFFAGFSGGRKSILPGICDIRTIKENHSYMQIASPYATAGVTENNPVHRDMNFAARKVNLQFILNVTMNAQKEVTGAFAGDMILAHEQAIKYVRNVSACERVMGDIVITSNGGYPLDQNLYQSPKAVATAEACCRDGGVIIMCCGCRDGMGGDDFVRLISMGTPQEIDDYLSKIPADQTIPQQWCVQKIVKTLLDHKIILVTDGLSAEEVTKANMQLAKTPDEALRMAYDIVGADAGVVVIPDGVAVLV